MFKKIHTKMRDKMIEIYVKCNCPLDNTYNINNSWRRSYFNRIIDFLNIVII